MELAPAAMEASWTVWLLPLAVASLFGFAAAAVMARVLNRSAVTPLVFKALVVGEFIVVSGAVFYVASSYTNLSLLPIQ